MKAKVDDRVWLTDASQTHTGTVTSRSDDGMCTVRWDSGSIEHVHESELHELEEETKPGIFGRIASLLNK